MSQELNDRIKDKLANYQSTIDDDALWESIENRVPKKEKQRRGAFWFMFGIFIVLGCSLGLWSSLPYKQNVDLTLKNSIELSAKVLPKDEIADDKNKKPIRTVDSDAKVINPKQKSTEKIAPVFSNTSENVSNHYSINEFFDQKTNPSMAMTTSMSLFASNIKSQDLELDNNPQENHNKKRVKSPMASINDLEHGVEYIKSMALKEVVSQTPKLSILQIKKPKRKKRIAPKLNSFWDISFTMGKFVDNKTIFINESRKIDDGKSYYQQSLTLKYGRFLSENFYFKADLTAQKFVRKFVANVQRDTIVPYSGGEQIIGRNEYINGVIDTESGIPEVQATIKRSVVNLNNQFDVSGNIGIGYLLRFNDLLISTECEVGSTFYQSRLGLGKENDVPSIKSLKSYPSYYNEGPKYRIGASLALQYSIVDDLNIVVGANFKKQLTDELLQNQNVSSKLHWWGGNIGLRKYIWK